MFYDNLKEACKNNNTTPTEVLKTLAISTGSLGNWKNGVLPKGEILAKLSTHLNVSADYLLFGTIEKKISTDNLSIDEVNIIEMYRDMSEEGKKELQSALRIIWAENRSIKNKSSISSDEKINTTIA